MQSIKSKALKTIQSKCQSRGFILLDCNIESPVDYSVKRHVKHSCGAEFYLRITNRDLLCPICSGRSVKLKDRSYPRAVQSMKELGFTLLCEESEWRGYKDGGKELKYKVRHDVCGTEFTTSLYTSHMSKCPTCQRKTKNRAQTFESFIRELQSKGLQPLFDQTEWKGVTHLEGKSQKSVTYPVRCKKCNHEFRVRQVPGRTSAGVNTCPYCTGSKTTLESSYKLFLKSLEDEGLEPLFDAGEFRGLYFRTGDHKLLRRGYKVRCKDCGYEFITSESTGKLKRCPCKLNKLHYRSTREQEVEAYLRGLGYRVCASDRSVLKGREIDIYLPDQRVGFEFNGMYFHSSSDKNPTRKDRLYHSKKSDAALAAGVRLYHIWEDCPDDLMYSIIESKLRITKRVYARKLHITSDLPVSVCAQFFKANHVDGNNRQSSVYLSLIDDSGEILCCLSLLRRRTQSTGKYNWEIGRFCNKKHTTVVGGYSRLLHTAIKYLKSIGVSTLYSYCNRDLSPDPYNTFYSKFGFEFVGDSGPIYWYWPLRSVDINGKIYSGRICRQAVQKSLLLKHFKSKGLQIEEGSTEQTLCERLGLVPVYNSGNFKYVLNIDRMD